MTPISSTRHHVQCLGPSGLHRMSYQQWGAADNPKVLVCVHGLTRNSHDFDFLAAALADDYRVICPDVVGRGQSDWLKHPAGYAIPQYVSDMLVLLARLDVEAVDWFGTSMGGLIGMSLASLPDTPIRKLILNDVGPLIQAAALKRIGQYVGQPPVWPDTETALDNLKQLFAPFGLQTDAEWMHLLQHTLRPSLDGGYTLNYDPAIAEPFRQAFAEEDISLWPIYRAIQCPVLAVRGAESDLLSRETWQAMLADKADTQGLEIAATGHAPMFTRTPEIEQVRSFLLADG